MIDLIKNISSWLIYQKLNYKASLFGKFVNMFKTW